MNGFDPGSIQAATRVIRSWGWGAIHACAASAGGSANRSRARVGVRGSRIRPRWPLKVCVADLEAGEIRERLGRRDEIQVRRQLFRGLQRLFKMRVAPSRGRGGGGFWLAPHWWFVDGVGREDADANRTILHPWSARLITGPFLPAARQQAHPCSAPRKWI